MGPFFAEIMEHILPVVNEEAKYDDRVRPPAKLAIYSGHDSTLAGVLSSLGPRVWNGSEPIAYASMVLIEVRREREKNCEACLCVSMHVRRWMELSK